MADASQPFFGLGSKDGGDHVGEAGRGRQLALALRLLGVALPSHGRPNQHQGVTVKIAFVQLRKGMGIGDFESLPAQLVSRLCKLCVPRSRGAMDSDGCPFRLFRHLRLTTSSCENDALAPWPSLEPVPADKLQEALVLDREAPGS